jgi:inorganic pyrophosphatase
MISFLRKNLYSTLKQGEGFSKRFFLLDSNGKKISPWNDVPLAPTGASKDVFNAFIEIPRFTLAKLEISKEEEFHPVKQDTRKNKQNPSEKELRAYAQFGSFNYGCFPQTWENSILPNKEIDNLLVRKGIFLFSGR